jgi:hypothetical protein
MKNEENSILSSEITDQIIHWIEDDCVIHWIDDGQVYRKSFS